MKRIVIYLLLLLYFFSYKAYVKAEEIKKTEIEEILIETNEEYVFFASKEEAEKIAEEFGGKITGYSNGIATMIISQSPECCYGSDSIIRNVSLEYNGVKIYPDLEVTIDQEGGVFDKQDYLIDLGIKEAWNVSKGQGIQVAVIDSGIDALHEELAHAISYEGSVIPEEYYGNLLDVSYKGTFDYLGHGTHVAGIIAASDDGKGTVGIAPDCSIISIKALEKRNGKGYGKTSWVARAIVEAVERGADVINLSVGGTTIGDSIMYEAIQYAYDANVPVVCAAGNNASQRMFYPAAYPETIAVSSVCKSGENYVFEESYSNFGSWINFCAPGTNIYSTYPGGYHSMTGTSMACPVVTGAIALVLSKNPDFTINQVITYLEKTAEDLGDIGRDDWYGHGMVNIGTLMNEFKEKPVPAMPVSSIPTGHYLTEGTQVQLFTDFSDAIIYYTMDGTDPDIESMIYNGSIFIEDESMKTVVIKAKAVSKEGISSEVGIFQYYILPKEKELADTSGKMENEVFPLYEAVKDEITNKACRKYSLLVPAKKKIIISMINAVPELVFRAYEENSLNGDLIGDYKEQDQKMVWENSLDSAKRILIYIVWNSEMERAEDISFSFQWTVEDYKKKEENTNNENIGQENFLTEENNTEIIKTDDTKIQYEEKKEIKQDEKLIQVPQDTAVVDIIQQEQVPTKQENIKILNEQENKQENEKQNMEPELYLETSSVEETLESQNDGKRQWGIIGCIIFVVSVVGYFFHSKR